MSGAHLFLRRLGHRVSGFLQSQLTLSQHHGGGDAGDPNLAHLLYLAFPDSALFFFPSFPKPLFDFKLLSTCTSHPFRTLTSCSFLPPLPSPPPQISYTSQLLFFSQQQQQQQQQQQLYSLYKNTKVG